MTPAEKRRQRDYAEHAPPIESKRTKIVDGDKNGISVTIGAHELASAFALASLATMSPIRQATTETTYESRDADQSHEAVPVSPDVRSPIRSQSKRVTFSNDTKVTSRITPRKLSFPPRTKQHGSRMPPGFARLPYHSRYQHHQHHPQPWMDQRMLANQHRQQASFGSMPPPPPIHTSSSHTHRVHSLPPPQSDKWICDFCNIAAFDTYQEAYRHEETCRVRCSMHQEHVRDWHPTAQAQVMYYPQGHNTDYAVTSTAEGCLHSGSRAWYQGETCLAIPESDGDWLSASHCLIREKCVEAFSATNDDVRAFSERLNVSLDQVGIRCRFCRHRPRDEMLQDAMSFPKSVRDIFESVKRLQKNHLEICQHVPQDIKSKMESSGSACTWVPTTRQYWIDSARTLGLVDTQDGMRFSTDPKNIPGYCLPDFQRSRTEATEEIDAESESLALESDVRSLGDGDSLVKPEDMSMVPAYVYFLMRQVETTHFTEADRFVARSKGPVGYSGFQCRHCLGHAGLGKYFPVSAKSLSTNSTSQNIHSHLLKCRKVTPFVKEQLIALKEEKSKAPRLEPGWRRIFFEKIWSRLHE